MNAYLWQPLCWTLEFQIVLPDHFWNSLGGAQRKSAEFMGQIGSLRKGLCERDKGRVQAWLAPWEPGTLLVALQHPWLRSTLGWGLPALRL